MATGKESARFGAGGTRVTALAFTADGQRLATGGADGWVQVWGAAAGTRLGGWKAHDRAVQAVAFEPGGDGVASGGADGGVQLWNVPDGKPRLRPIKYRTAVQSLTFSGDGKLLAVGVEVGAQVIKVADGSVGPPLLVGPVYAAFFAADGGSVTLLTARGTGSTFRGTLRLTDAAGVGRPRLELPPEP
jgi:WD40 repeat protein